MADNEKTSDLVSKFDGTGNIDFWLKLVEAARVEKGWKEEDLVKRATLLLRGEAKTWFENGRLWEREDMDWKTFSNLIRQRFSRSVPRHVVLTNIGKLKLKPREDVRDFAARMMALAHQSEPAIDTVDMCGIIIVHSTLTLKRVRMPSKLC